MSVDQLQSALEEAYRPRTVIAETAEYVLTFHYDQIMAPRIFIGPPGIGKSMSILEGFSLATLAVASLYKTDDLDKDMADLRDHADKVLKKIGVGEPNPDVVLKEAANRIKEARSRCSRDELCKDLVESITIDSDFHRYVKDHIASKVPLASINSVLADIARYGTRGLNKLPQLRRRTSDLVILFGQDLKHLDIFRDSFVVHKLEISSFEPADLLGVLGFENVDGRTVSRHYPPDWAYALRDASLGMLFLDEFTNQMVPYLETIVMGLMSDNRIGEMVLNKPVVGAGNDAASSRMVRPLPGAVTSGRTLFLPVRPPSVSEWIRYMKDRYGTKWFMAPSFLLLLFSKYGIREEMRIPSNALTEVAKLTEVLIGDDPFLASPQRIKRFSSFHPSVNSPTSFPSPRSWERALVELHFHQRRLSCSQSSSEAAEIRKKRVISIAKHHLGDDSLARILYMLLCNQALSLALSAVLNNDSNSSSRTRAELVERGLDFFAKATDLERISNIVRSILNDKDNEKAKNEFIEIITVLAIATNIIIHAVRYSVNKIRLLSGSTNSSNSSKPMEDLLILAYGILKMMRLKAQRIKDDKKGKIDFWSHAIIASQLAVLREVLLREELDFLVMVPKSLKGNISDELVVLDKLAMFIENACTNKNTIEAIEKRLRRRF